MEPALTLYRNGKLSRKVTKDLVTARLTAGYFDYWLCIESHQQSQCIWKTGYFEKNPLFSDN
jgi:hypothetical protein